MAGHNIHYSLLHLVYSFYLRYGARVWKPTTPEQLYIDFAAGLVNQSRGGRPVNIVEHGLVQDVRMRSNASWPLMAMSSFSHKKVN